MMKKILILLAAGFMLAFLLLLGFSCWILSLFISETPASLPKPLLKQEAFQTLCLKLAPLPLLIKNSKPGQIESITLSPEEIDLMIIIAFNKDKASSILFSGSIPPEILENLPPLAFSDGSFIVGADKKLSFTTPFGSYVNIAASFSIDDKNPGTKVRLEYFRIGDASIPPVLGNSILQSVDYDKSGNLDIASSSGLMGALAGFLKKTDSSEGDEDIDLTKIIPSIKSGSSGISLKYYPYQLKLLLESHLKDGPAKTIWNAL